MNNQKGFKGLSLKELKDSFDNPSLLTKSNWRSAGTIADLPMSVLNYTDGYEFQNKDVNRLIFVLEKVEDCVENKQSGLLLSWRLWDTSVTFESFVSESEATVKGLTKNTSVCRLVLGGDSFEDTFFEILKKVSNDPFEIYEVCREQEGISLENLVQVLQ